MNKKLKNWAKDSLPKGRRITTLKKILSAGKGQLPNYERLNTKAVFHYEVFAPPKSSGVAGEVEEEDAEQCRLRIFPEDRSLYNCIDSTKKCWPNGYGKPLEVVFGKKFQLPLFEDCVRTMLVDEIAQFDVFDPRELLTFPMVSKKLRDISRSENDPKFAREHEHSSGHHCAASVAELGYPELDELVQGGPRPLRIVFHLISVFAPDEYAVDNWQLDETQRLANVDVLREEGNRLFGRKDFEGAANKYREGLTLIDQLLLREKPGDTEWTNLDWKNVPLFLNLAQCYLNLGQFYDAANCATEVLKREPDNEKALFRRAKANMNKWNLDEAVTDLRRLEKNGKCSEMGIVETALAEVEEKKRLKERDEKKALRAMFRGIGGVTGDQ
uniref:AIP/AIPL N-terminal FKBP-type PPIase domain-containing protein n=1 Tax=Globodera rostochiensis TaxID=31243 RepID=A0A914HV30_GLORO